MKEFKDFTFKERVEIKEEQASTVKVSSRDSSPNLGPF